MKYMTAGSAMKSSRTPCRPKTVTAESHTKRGPCLARIAELGAEKIICLGDIVGYGADPNPVSEWVRDAVMQLDGLKSCNVNLTFDPPWDQSMMSDEAKLQLNMF